jgi:hypothetical protein
MPATQQIIGIKITFPDVAHLHADYRQQADLEPAKNYGCSNDGGQKFI